jgi:hypothetical protein
VEPVEQRHRATGVIRTLDDDAGLCYPHQPFCNLIPQRFGVATHWCWRALVWRSVH